MNRLFAEVRPNADVEYLASALIRDALSSKFKDLFGRDPVARTTDDPAHVENGRVPDLVLESVDANISKLLKASAIEASDNAVGNVPEINNCTLLYTVLDDSQAQIALESVKEYQALDQNSRDATIQAVNELDDVTIEEGVAFISPEHSTIRIGVYVDNKLLGEEFQYRLEAGGGKKIDSNDKVKIFDTLFNDLPGGDNVHESDIRSKLMGVVGLGEEAPAGTDARQNATEAPGPEPKPMAAGGEQETTEEAMPAQKTESSKIETDSFFDGRHIFEVGATVHSIHEPHRLFIIKAIYACKEKADLKLVDLTNADSLVLDSSEVVTY